MLVDLVLGILLRHAENRSASILPDLEDGQAEDCSSTIQGLNFDRDRLSMGTNHNIKSSSYKSLVGNFSMVLVYYPKHWP